MKTIKWLLVFCLVATCLADSPDTPSPKVTASQNGRFFFLMSPSPNNETVKNDNGVGVMYCVKWDGTFQPIWKVNGWYASNVFVSNDGEFLVRIGNWPMGSSPSKLDLAVAFYARDKLLRSYSTGDLVKNNSSVNRSVSHYDWLSDQTSHPMRLRAYKFNLTTSDNITYYFDIKTGNMNEE